MFIAEIGRDNYAAMRKTPSKLKVTPPELAALWGVSPAKVLRLIRTGELRAINLATSLGHRPRYAIDVADVAAFELSRTVVPEGNVAKTIRQRRHEPNTTKDYFP